MANSRIVGPLGRHSGFLWRTPGPIGKNDAGDPDVSRIHTTDTAGPLGYKDWADPDHPAYRARMRRVAWEWPWAAKTHNPPTRVELKNDPKVKECLLACLAWSYDENDEVQGEQGGWIYSSPESPYNYHFEIAPVAKRFKRAINLENPPDLALKKLWVVGSFHTHPAREEIARYPSRPGDPGIKDGKEADTQVQERYGVPGLVINYLKEIYEFGPMFRRGGWESGYGFPGRSIF